MSSYLFYTFTSVIHLLSFKNKRNIVVIYLREVEILINEDEELKEQNFMTNSQPVRR